MSTVYWRDQTVVVEFTLTDPADSTPIADATIAGTATLPDGTTAAMTAANLGAGSYTVSYDPQTAGRHAYRIVATGTADWATEGEFTVHTALSGAEPITVDPTTDVGMIRTLATDLDETAPLFTDAQITAFLMLEGSVRRAAALALETIAASEAVISKKIRTLDLSTDGPAVAKELRERAAALRAQQQKADDEAGVGVFAFDIVDYDPYYGEWA